MSVGVVIEAIDSQGIIGKVVVMTEIVTTSIKTIDLGVRIEEEGIEVIEEGTSTEITKITMMHRNSII